MMKPYTFHELEVGRIRGRKETVRSFLMPRADFLEVVEDTLANFEDDELPKDELRKTAREMPRFPMRTWIADKRGCGCVVGEYLIATAELARAEIARRSREGRLPIAFLMEQNPQGEALSQFGTDVDSALIAAVRRLGGGYRAAETAGSIEILD